MVAPVYLTDLVTVDDAETATGWTGIGGGSVASDTTFAIQGLQAIERSTAGGTTGTVFTAASALDLTGGNHIYVWTIAPAPGVTDTLQNGGVGIAIGDSRTVYVLFHVEGGETYADSGRTGKCYPIQFVNTASLVVPYRTLIGSPSAAPDSAGARTTVSGKAKFAVDAVRLGTGGFITDGEVADPATFQGFGTENTLIDNRWGILTRIAGSFELQGKFVIGQNASKVATQAHFEDSNVNIIIPDTPHTSTDFSEFIFDHASTISKWTNINITALGTNNRGTITVNAASPAVDWTDCTWTGIAVTTMQADTTSIGHIWRDTDQVISNGGSITNGLFDKSRAVSALDSDLAGITTCTFASAGTGHAVDAGTITASVSKTWNSNDSGYAAVDGSTGNETILVSVDSGFTLTINVASGASTPTIKNDGLGTVTVVASVGLDWTVIDKAGSAIAGAQISCYLVSDNSEVITPTDTNVSGIVSDSYAGSTPVDMYYRVRKSSAGDTKYKLFSAFGTIGTSGFAATITLTVDPNNNT